MAATSHRRSPVTRRSSAPTSTSSTGLKNHVRELGPLPYALVTDAAAQAIAIPTAGMVATEEACEDTLPIPAHILVLTERFPAAGR